MALNLNRARMTVSGAPGTGTITLLAAVTGYDTFANAGAVNASVYSYLAEDGLLWEYGTGTYTAVGTTLTRTVVRSSAGTTAVSLTANAIVSITMLAADKAYAGANTDITSLTPPAAASLAVNAPMTVGNTTVIATDASFTWYSQSAGTNEKFWSLYALTSGDMVMRLFDDAAGTPTDVMTFARNALALTNLTLTFPVSVGAGTTSNAPLQMVSGTNLTTPTAGAWEYDGVVHYSTHAANERGVALSQQVMILSAAYTLASQTPAQKLLNATTNGQITLAVGTYEFECFFSLTAMSATSGSFGFALGGTATKTQGWQASANKAALATPTSMTDSFNTAANTALTAANTTTTGYARIKGFIRVTVAGTVIPQVSLGVAAAAIVGANSFFKLWPVGNGTVTTVGNWS